MKLVVLLIKGFCNLTEKQKATLKTLKLRKNTLRIMEDTPINRSLLTSTSLLHWCEAEETEIKSIFKEKEIYHLNNPKKGHIYKTYGFKSYETFKKDFIDRMYLRL